MVNFFIGNLIQSAASIEPYRNRSLMAGVPDEWGTRIVFCSGAVVHYEFLDADALLAEFPKSPFAPKLATIPMGDPEAGA